jgi:ABC-2 type transport system ATP-binding protein
VTGRGDVPGSQDGRAPVPAVEVRDLVRRFKSLVAVDDVTFAVQQGEMFALLGPNGAGKTTTIRTITTLLKPDAGSVHVFGADVRRSPMTVRRMIGYVPQQLAVDGQLNGYENVWLFARLFDVPRRQRKERIEQALSVVGLEHAAGRMASTYSGGMVRRLELAQALVNRPRMLLLDEPTIGLDPIARRGIWERVFELRDDYGMTVLFTTHYMEEADALSDRVALMHRGRLRVIGAPADLKEEIGPEADLEDVFRAYAGEDLQEKGSLRDVSNTRRTFRRLS